MYFFAVNDLKKNLSTDNTMWLLTNIELFIPGLKLKD